MTVQVEKLLHLFDDLPNNEQWKVAFEILQRPLYFDLPTLQDDDFIHIAKDLFLALDYEESVDEIPQTR